MILLHALPGTLTDLFYPKYLYGPLTLFVTTESFKKYFFTPIRCGAHSDKGLQ